MDKYLKILKEIEKSESKFTNKTLIRIISRYVRGDITVEELLSNTDERSKKIIYYTLNKIINYQEKDVKYYVRLPDDMFYNTLGAPAILAGKVLSSDYLQDELKTLGPVHQIRQFSGFYSRGYAEITGNFSKLPCGVMLYQNDWGRIISKYPDLYKRMFYLALTDSYLKRDVKVSSVKSKLSDKIEFWRNAPADFERNVWWEGKDSAEYLPKDILDSIKFVVPEEYLGFDRVVEENFGDFKTLLNGEGKRKVVAIDKVRALEYLESIYRTSVIGALKYDMFDLLEETITQQNDEAKMLIVLDFIMNYDGENKNKYLQLFEELDLNVLKGTVEGIPLVLFAQYNNPAVYAMFRKKGIKAILHNNQEIDFEFLQNKFRVLEEQPQFNRQLNNKKNSD